MFTEAFASCFQGGPRHQRLNPLWSVGCIFYMSQGVLASFTDTAEGGMLKVRRSYWRQHRWVKCRKVPNILTRRSSAPFRRPHSFANHHVVSSTQAANFYFAEYDCFFESIVSQLIELAWWLAMQSNLGFRSVPWISRWYSCVLVTSTMYSSLMTLHHGTVIITRKAAFYRQYFYMNITSRLKLRNHQDLRHSSNLSHIGETWESLPLLMVSLKIFGNMTWDFSTVFLIRLRSIQKRQGVLRLLFQGHIYWPTFAHRKAPLGLSPARTRAFMPALSPFY